MQHECNMKKVQHGKSATRKKSDMEKIQDRKSATLKSATWKKCYMEKVQHGKSATWEKYNMEKVQHENSRDEARTYKNLRWRILQQCLTALVIIAANLSVVDVCEYPGKTSGNSAK